MYSLLGNVIRLDGGIVKRAFSTIISMPPRLTTRKGNSRSHSRGRQTHSRCCRYRFFRSNSAVRYSGVRLTSRDDYLLSAFAGYPGQLSRGRFDSIAPHLLTWSCFRMVSRTKRNRQAGPKRVARSLGHCIFIETSCEIVDSDLCTESVYSTYPPAAISFVSQLLRVLLVLDPLIATYSRGRLQKGRLQALRGGF